MVGTTGGGLAALPSRGFILPYVMVQHFPFPWWLLQLAASAGEVTEPGSISFT